MRRVWVELRGFPGVLWLWPLLLLLLTLGGDEALSQYQEPSIAPPPFSQSTRKPYGEDPEEVRDPMKRRAMEEAMKKRNVERQQRLLADSDRIVQLARDLNATVEANPSGNLRSVAAKRAEEIEKLAKSVRERMKGE